MLNKDENQIIEEFNTLDNWEDKYEYIIYLGKKLKIPNMSIKQDKYLISGCVSRVWIKKELVSGRVQFTMQSDSSIIQGILYLLFVGYNDMTPQEIEQKEPEILKIVEVEKLLSLNRRVGVEAVIKRIKDF